MSPEYRSCSGVMKVKANPLLPALPVRLQNTQEFNDDSVQVNSKIIQCNVFGVYGVFLV